MKPHRWGGPAVAAALDWNLGSKRSGAKYFSLKLSRVWTRTIAQNLEVSIVLVTQQNIPIILKVFFDAGVFDELLVVGEGKVGELKPIVVPWIEHEVWCD